MLSTSGKSKFWIFTRLDRLVKTGYNVLYAGTDIHAPQARRIKDEGPDSTGFFVVLAVKMFVPTHSRFADDIASFDGVNANCRRTYPCLVEGEEMTGHDPSDQKYYEPALDMRFQSDESVRV